MGDKFKITGDDAGLHIVLQLPNELTESKAIQKANLANVHIDSFSQFDQSDHTSNKVILGYGSWIS
ncbi:hypothetical protein UACE39S_06500 [Ureibacillus acetophenoni]